MATPFVRPFNFSTDDSACLHVFHTTADPSVSRDPARTIGAHLWYKAYAHLTPSTCFVLDSGNGHAVGYIIGTEDTAAFSQNWKTTFGPALDAGLVPPPGLVTEDPGMETDHVRGLRAEAYGGMCSLLLAFPALLARYPAHLHVNILPEYQGKGWGRALMAAFLERVRRLGACGVHLGMVATNEGAGRFYGSVGFERCGKVLDGGMSGEVGREGGSVWLVMRL